MTRRAPVFWAAFALMMAVYLTMALWSLPQLRQMAGGLLAFDLRPFGYDPQAARALVAALGPDGREFYQDVQQRLDTAYPALLALVLVLAFRMLARGWTLWVFGAISIAAAAADYAENAAVAVMLRAGPDAISDAMVMAASRWTTLKSGLASVAFIALLALLVPAVWRKARPKARRRR